MEPSGRRRWKRVLARSALTLILSVDELCFAKILHRRQSRRFWFSVMLRYVQRRAKGSKHLDLLFLQCWLQLLVGLLPDHGPESRPSGRCVVWSGRSTNQGSANLSAMVPRAGCHLAAIRHGGDRRVGRAAGAPGLSGVRVGTFLR